MRLFDRSKIKLYTLWYFKASFSAALKTITYDANPSFADNTAFAVTIGLTLYLKAYYKGVYKVA